MKSDGWAGLLAGGYVAVAGTWILLSSRFAATSAGSVEELARIELLKGVGYVAVTAAALFAAARYVLGRIERRGAELLRRERALVANDRRVFAGLMASSVAHDANNVLTLVLSDLEMLDGTVDRATLDRLHGSIDRLVQLNRRVVQAARQTTSTALNRVELGEAVRDAVGLARSHPAVRYATINVATEDPLHVVATPLLLSQIVINLVVNAAEATAGKGTIAVSVARDDRRAVIVVDDDGPGIAPERRAGIFDALVTTKSEGNGIGLFSVKASAVALGGSVAVGQSPLGGASFRVTLPLAAATG